MTADYHETQKVEARRLTKVTDRATGTFLCSSSNHRAKGEPVIVRGRKVCAACNERRLEHTKGKARG